MILTFIPLESYPETLFFDHKHRDWLQMVTENLKVTKANKLIEITLVESATRLSVRDQKIILAVISQISPDDEKFKTYNLSIKELVDMTGISNRNLYCNIHAICNRITSSTITIKEPSNPNGFLMASWFSDAEYKPKEGLVEFSVSPKLRPYLLKLKSHFTTYYLHQVVNLSSTYSIRMYELLRQFLPINSLNKGQSSSFREIAIDDLRGYLGVKEGRYERFAIFRKHVIEKSQDELSGKTDIAFEFEPIRVGRKVRKIKFHIRHNPRFEEIREEELTGDHIPMNDQEPNPEAENLIRATIQMQMPEINLAEQELILATYPREMIMEALLSLSATEIRTTRKKAFLGILKGMRSDAKADDGQKVDIDDFSWLRKDFD